MKLSPMRYKDYVWPHNPRTYEIAYEKKLVMQKVPFGRFFLQNMGMKCRVLRGEGEFSGPGAYDEFKKLATVFYENTPGLLVHPVWQTSNAYFVNLSLKQMPYEDYVSYTFEFWEDYGYRGTATVVKEAPKEEPVETGGGAGRIYTVVSGDTMWAIAKRHNMALSDLIALNPQIKNPNRIYPGNVIYLTKR